MRFKEISSCNQKDKIAQQLYFLTDKDDHFCGKEKTPINSILNRTGIAGWLFNIHGLEIILLNQITELFMKNRFSWFKLERFKITNLALLLIGKVSFPQWDSTVPYSSTPGNTLWSLRNSTRDAMPLTASGNNTPTGTYCKPVIAYE